MVSVGVAGIACSFWRRRNISERRHTYVLPVFLVGLVPVTTVAAEKSFIPPLYFAVVLTANLLLLLIPMRVARVTRVAVCATAEKTRCVRIRIIIRKDWKTEHFHILFAPSSARPQNLPGM